MIPFALHMTNVGTVVLLLVSQLLACAGVDLPKSSCRKERDDLSQTAHSWKTQLDGRTVFGTAGGTFDHDV